MSETTSKPQSLVELEAMRGPIQRNREELNRLSAEIQAKREAFEASITELVEQQKTAKVACADDETRFRETCLKYHEESGDKRFLNVVLIQDRQVVEEYDKVAVESWVRQFHPGWLVPDWKLLEKVALAQVKGLETPLVVGIKKTVAVDMDKVKA